MTRERTPIEKLSTRTPGRGAHQPRCQAGCGCNNLAALQRGAGNRAVAQLLHDHSPGLQGAGVRRPELVAQRGLWDDLKGVASDLGKRVGLGPDAPSCVGTTGTPARSFSAFVGLIRAAEAQLIAKGKTNAETRLHMLTSIWYGAEWSLDFEQEKSAVRNKGFELYTAARFTDDPRAYLDCHLFQSLKHSQDVQGVDMDHAMIGMDARERYASREVNLPGHAATGLEVSTWVGDLGGATGRLAYDRVTAPTEGAARWFAEGSGDYGAPSNLEGDLAAYLVGAAPADHEATAPQLGKSGMIADAIEQFFVAKGARAGRGKRFLELQGGHLAGGQLSNRAQVEAAMAAKLAGFGRLYMVNFYRQRDRIDTGRLSQANGLLPQAGADVAAHFVTLLLSGRFN